MKKLKLLSALALAAPLSAFAAVPEPVTEAVNVLTTDGSATISLVGGGLITLAGLVIVFKWAKAAFFG